MQLQTAVVDGYGLQIGLIRPGIRSTGVQVGIQGREGCGACLYGENFGDTVEAEADERILMAAGGSAAAAIVKGCEFFRAREDWAG